VRLPAQGNYCGGTFEGIVDRLDYIAGMGFDAIWISPIVDNIACGYHGYWAQHQFQIEEHFGGAAGLHKLVRKRVFLRHFILKTIILPRQARDKHRENTQKHARFLIDGRMQGQGHCRHARYVVELKHSLSFLNLTIMQIYIYI
jgi:hypothetical protein